MSKAIKAALLSALVFPGAGHFFLKKHLTGIILTGSTFTSFAVILSKALERAQQIAEKIQLGEVPLDITTISELVSRQPLGTETNLLDLATAALIVSWLIGIVDSYRVGRVQDNRAGR